MKNDKPRGRPRNNEVRETLISVTFKIDQETEAALAELERRYGLAGVRGRRSVLLRKLILDAVTKER